MLRGNGGTVNVTSPLEQFAFVDSVIAAEVLHATQDAVLDWVRDGTLKAYGGKPSNPFLRSKDVGALIEKLGIVEEEPKRTKSPTAKVQTRITADARWSDVSVDDIYLWVSRADESRRQAAKSAAETAQHRIATLLTALAAQEK
jgi:hypothetical protein